MTQTRICVWSGPRNVSTAIMYAFAQRADTHVLDEPLYGHYLTRTGADHPGRDEILSHIETQAEKAILEQILGDYDEPILFIKNMAHHLVGLDVQFLDLLQNIFLIRNPRDVLPSLAKLLPEPAMLDTAYKMQYHLFQMLHKRDRNPLVIDSLHLLTNPEGVLREVCMQTGIPFDPAMLHWKAGALPQEGLWAKYWYQNVHSSTGFLPYKNKEEPVPVHLLPLLEECYDYYLKLYEHAIGATPETSVASS